MEFDAFLDTPLTVKVECREALYDPTPLFEDFLADNSEMLSEEDRATIESWRDHHLFDMFAIYRHLKEHTIFINSESPPQVYGALGLTTELSEIAPALRLPVLLPYEGRIVCDGIVLMQQVMIGPNMRRELKEIYENARRRKQVITSLGLAPSSVANGASPGF